VPGLQVVSNKGEWPRGNEPLDAPILSQGQIRQCADRVRIDHLSPPTSYRLDNCHCLRRAKDNDEHQVALRRRKTTTKRRQRRERGHLANAWVHPESPSSRT